jgi:hypothetical protein
LNNPYDLITGVDRVDDNIAKCIKLAEDALQRRDDSASPTRNRPKVPHHRPAATGDIFSGIHRVNKGIADCISLAESTMRCINPREPKEFDYNFNDFIGKLESPRPSPIRSERSYPRPSPHWKRTWTIYYSSEKEKPSRVGGLPFPITTRIWLLT